MLLLTSEGQSSGRVSLTRAICDLQSRGPGVCVAGRARPAPARGRGPCAEGGGGRCAGGLGLGGGCLAALHEGR